MFLHAPTNINCNTIHVTRLYTRAGYEFFTRHYGKNVSPKNNNGKRL